VSPIRSVALIDPVSDSGIGGFTHELAQGLAACDVAVDVYARGAGYAQDLPRDYRLHPVLGGEVATAAPTASESSTSVMEPYFDVLARRGMAGGRLRARPPDPEVGPVIDRGVTSATLAAEGTCAASRIAATRPDVVWTQWPDLGADGRSIDGVCQSMGIPVVHTVHNVVPHERTAGDVEYHDARYRGASALVVHSDMAAQALGESFPSVRDRIVRSRHGLYTIFPRRPAMRDAVRARLEVGHGGPVVLMFGGVRPYKNLDAVLEAMADPRCAGLTLVVAGWEWGYPERVPGDRLGRTRAQVWRAGLSDRVRLLPGPFGRAQAAELFEAADAVALPYLDGWGSGLLLLAMTFGKYVLPTAVGGMHEYLTGYDRATRLAGPSAEMVADGLAAFAAGAAVPEPALPGALAWPTIARRVLEDLGQRLQ
jgi:glycosyltransferase involved in cell wall biosynthesis